MSNLEFGVQYEDGKIFDETSDRDDVISALLWAMDMREQLDRRGYAADAKMFMNPKIVVRDLDDDEPQAWAPLDISDEEIQDYAREHYGEVD